MLVALYLAQAYRVAETEAQIQTKNLVSLVRVNFDALIDEIDIALRTLAAEPVTGPESEARRLKLVDAIVREDADGTLHTLPPREAAKHVDDKWDLFLDHLPDPMSVEGVEVAETQLPKKV